MSLTSIFQPIRKRTKRAYLRLFDAPDYLFGRGTRTIVFPNGEREIWISNHNGTASFKIRASDGPAGFSITVLSTVGALPADAHVLRQSDYQTEMTTGAREVSMIAYYPDAGVVMAIAGQVTDLYPHWRTKLAQAVPEELVLVRWDDREYPIVHEDGEVQQVEAVRNGTIAKVGSGRYAEDIP